MPKPSLSSRAALLQPSPTLGITAKANAMRAAGEDVISLGAGEPDFPTPDAVCEAAIQAIREGFTKYTPTGGIAPLREAIAAKLCAENGLSVSAGQIVVTAGAKQALYEAAMVALEPGDEAILIAPYWMTYAEQIRLAGATPVAVHTRQEEGFQPDLDELRQAIGPRTRAIFVNTPCNPTGAVYPHQTVRAIADLAVAHGLWIVADEIYERLTYDAEHHSIAAMSDAAAACTITVGGCSKTYAMTGWRIGYAAAPAHVASAMTNLQDQVTSNAVSFAQKGALRALSLPREQVETMRQEFRARRDLIIQCLAEIPGVATTLPQGAFYVLPNVREFLADGESDLGLAERLLTEARVAVIPGSVFEAPGHLRISYAAGRDQIRAGIARIAEVLSKVAR